MTGSARKPTQAPETAPSLVRSSPRPGARGLYGSTPDGNLARSGAAELIGTFVLVLVGTATSLGAATTTPPVYDLLAVVLAFAVALVALVAALGHVCGCHLNPAITLGLAVTRRFPWRAVPVYLLAQLAGAVLAALAAWAVHAGRGREVVAAATTVPAPGVPDARAFFVEALITFVLVLVVISVATDDRVPAAVAPVAVGAALAACIFIAAPVTGGAVNPARALGPALVSGNLDSLWVYLTAPLVGGVLGAVVYDRVLGRAHTPEPEG